MQDEYAVEITPSPLLSDAGVLFKRAVPVDPVRPGLDHVSGGRAGCTLRDDYGLPQPESRYAMAD